MEKIPPIEELIMTFRRHFAKFVVIIILGVIASILYALNQPRTYQTAAMVQILQPVVPDATSRGTSSGATLQRLQIVEQRLMSRDNLLKIIQEYDLYPGLGVSDKVLRLRMATHVEKIQDQALRWRSDVSPTALMIMVTDGDPERAAMIANRFAESLMVQSRESSEAKASEALKFYESERSRIGAEITELDARIARFKEENSAVMPDGLASLRAELVNLNAVILQLESKIVALKNEVAGVRHSVVKSKLQGLEEQYALLERKRKDMRAQLARGPEVERELTALNRRLEQLTAQYSIINTNRAEAEMGLMLEASQKSSDFEILETALVPEHPIAPNRKKITMVGVALSIVLAVGLIVVLEMTNPVIRSGSQLSRRLGITPVITVPTLQAPKYSLAERFRFFWGKLKALKSRA